MTNKKFGIIIMDLSFLISGRNRLVGISRRSIFARHTAKAQDLSRHISESRERERDLESDRTQKMSVLRCETTDCKSDSSTQC